MNVYGLHGKSGTGKSYHAMTLCKDLDLDAIIDDGLFIYGNRVIAGISAKRQNTKIGAIKTALFTNEEHRDEVKQRITEIDPPGILIIGTSEAMVEKIRTRLDLPDFTRIVTIEEITTEDQREIAYKQRKELGKHVIPAPTFQIKRQFSGYILDPLRIFKSWGGRTTFSEKTVVRPTFSFLGDYNLSDKVIVDIASYEGKKLEGVDDILRVTVHSSEDGVAVSLWVIMKYGYPIPNVGRNMQVAIARQIENMTAFNVNEVNVDVRGIR